jgi:hypothetical protein
VRQEEPVARVASKEVAGTERRATPRLRAAAPRQVWGVELFTGRDAAGQTIELSVYGRDASDARVLAKLWRFCFYRDSGPR